MGIFGHKDHSEYLFSFENLENETQDQQLEYSNVQCEIDTCPFFALKDMEFCQEHQKEYENIQNGKNPS